MSSNGQACTLLHHLIEQQAAKEPDSIALWWQHTAISYATLYRNAIATAKRLASIGNVGDRVAVLSWNCPQFVELIYGAAAAGKVLVPLNTRLAPAELNYQLQSAGVTMLFGDPELIKPLLAQSEFPYITETIFLDEQYLQWREFGPCNNLPENRSEDLAWILFTSGSTGRPKGAMLSHRSFMAGLESAALARPVLSYDRYYYPFPLFHVSAHNVLLQHLYGASVVLARSFDATDALAACSELRVTTMSLAPTMIALLLDDPRFTPKHLDSVRTIGYGASAMPQTLLQRLLNETDVGLCQSYGMTELSGSVSFLTVDDHREAAHEKPTLLQSVGRPLSTIKLKLVDEEGRNCATGAVGEIWVKGTQCMIGYWEDDAATEQAMINGWLLTGDLGRFDEEGYLYIVDRKKDMIISGGENIASREIEEVLRRHASVKDCAIIGLSDPKWGESPCAVVRLKNDVSDSELRDHCRIFLANYKTPRHWVRVDDLPLNASGKIDKPLLRRLYGIAG